jgi:hypothetical protein
MSQFSALFDPKSSRQPAREAPRIRVSTWHYDTIIDHLLANPGATYGEIAEVLGRGQVWISMVMRSDAFQAHYAQRRVVVNEAIRDSVADKIAEVAIASADLTLRHMKENPQGLGFNQKVDTLIQASKALGFGLAPPAPAAQVNIGTNTVMLASRDQIDKARERLRSIQADNAAAGEARAREIVTASVTDSSMEQRRTFAPSGAFSPAGGTVSSADSSYTGAATRPVPPAKFEYEDAVVVGTDQ